MPVHAICLHRRRRSILRENRVRRTVGDFTVRVVADYASNPEKQTLVDRLIGREVPSETHSLRWPQVCAHCAERPATTSVAAVAQASAAGELHTRVWPIPYCARCKDEHTVFGLVPQDDLAVWFIGFELCGSSQTFMFKNHKYARLFCEANEVVLVCSACRTPLDRLDPYCSNCNLAHPARRSHDKSAAAST